MGEPGGGLLATNPALAQRLISKGITLSPDQAIGWFNLGIGLHQQRKIPAAIKAYEHCLALPHSVDTGIAARNNLSQDLLLHGMMLDLTTNASFANPAITQFLPTLVPLMMPCQTWINRYC